MRRESCPSRRWSLELETATIWRSLVEVGTHKCLEFALTLTPGLPVRHILTSIEPLAVVLSALVATLSYNRSADGYAGDHKVFTFERMPKGEKSDNHTGA